MNPHEFKLIALRECLPKAAIVDGPSEAVDYWQRAVVKSAAFSPLVENLAVIILNCRLRILGHQMIGLGTLDCVLMTAREVFRAAILHGAHGIVLMHNHPSGDPTPSRHDFRATQSLRKAGRILGIEMHDHIIIGQRRAYCSLRALGYFAEPPRKRRRRNHRDALDKPSLCNAMTK